MTFVDGRLAQEDVDTNHDGKPDVWKFYVDGQLQRIRRDRNSDGKPDIWEIYARGRLERVGFDDSFDGHVNRSKSRHRDNPTCEAVAAGLCD